MKFHSHKKLLVREPIMVLTVLTFVIGGRFVLPPMLTAQATTLPTITVRSVRGIDDANIKMFSAPEWSPIRLHKNISSMSGANVLRPNSGTGITVTSPKKNPGRGAAVWTFTNLSPGQYNVYATWPVFDFLNTAAEYTIKSGSGAAKTIVDQTKTAWTGKYGSLPWLKIGQMTVTGGTLKVELDGSAKYTIADAILIDRTVDLLPSSSTQSSSRSSSARSSSVSSALARADLSITMRGSSPFRGELYHQIFVTNLGPNDMPSYTVRNVIPPGFVFQGSATPQGGCTVDANKTSLVCTASNLKAGIKETFDITYRAADPANCIALSAISNATVSGSGAIDNALANNTTATVVTTVNCPPRSVASSSAPAIPSSSSSSSAVSSRVSSATSIAPPPVPDYVAEITAQETDATYGDALHYNITVTNVGEFTNNPVIVTLRGMFYPSHPPENCTRKDDFSVQCNLGVIRTNEEVKNKYIRVLSSDWGFVTGRTCFDTDGGINFTVVPDPNEKNTANNFKSASVRMHCPPGVATPTSANPVTGSQGGTPTNTAASGVPDYTATLLTYSEAVYGGSMIITMSVDNIKDVTSKHVEAMFYLQEPFQVPATLPAGCVAAGTSLIMCDMGVMTASNKSKQFALTLPIAKYNGATCNPVNVSLTIGAREEQGEVNILNNNRTFTVPIQCNPSVKPCPNNFNKMSIYENLRWEDIFTDNWLYYNWPSHRCKPPYVCKDGLVTDGPVCKHTYTCTPRPSSTVSDCRKI
jgi:hypothetical protein